MSDENKQLRNQVQALLAMMTRHFEQSERTQAMAGRLGAFGLRSRRSDRSASNTSGDFFNVF